MKKYLIILFLIFLTTKSSAEIKENIIQKLKDTKNISFNFEQNINGKIENGNCIVQYPKKIYCKYKLNNEKILVSNGKSLVIKTKTSFYLYPLEKTPLNFILDKNYLIDKIKLLNERIVENKFINFTFVDNDNEINIFFSKKNFNLIGWQTLDIYQNLNITFLSSISKNQKIDKSLFILPKQN
tara:strand:+ start:45 stop:593 length:549 start_codon:yes stop_codon:yes gene_type:complete